MSWIGRVIAWMTAEYMTDIRDSKARVFDVIIKNNLHLNTIILTVSIASLTAVAALSNEMFESHPVLTFVSILLFVMVILLSTINFYISGLALSDLHQKLSKDILFPFKVSKGVYEPKFKGAQKILSTLVLSGFCLGLLVLSALLGCYILETA